MTTIIVENKLYRVVSDSVRANPKLSSCDNCAFNPAPGERGCQATNETWDCVTDKHHYVLAEDKEQA